MNKEVVTLQLGKNGISKEFISEVRNTLEKRKTVRIKILKSAVKTKEKKMLIQEMEKKLNIKKITSKGNVIMIDG